MVVISADVLDDDEEQQLCVRCDSTKYVHQLLRTIDFREHATVTALEDGLRVSVDELRSLQANVYLRREMFSQFTLSEYPFTFKECLNLYSNEPTSSTAMKMTYKAFGEPLKIVLDKAGVVTDCAVRTLHSDDPDPFEFGDDAVLTKIIMKCDPLREVISEIEKPCDSIRFDVRPQSKMLVLSAGSRTALEITVKMPSTMESMEYFHAAQPQNYAYRLSQLKYVLRALHLASKVSVRIDEHGMMSMQMMVTHDNELTSFIEFYIAPEEEMNDEDSF